MPQGSLAIRKSFRVRRMAVSFGTPTRGARPVRSSWRMRLPGWALACLGKSIGSVAMNNHRHLEAYYAVSGSGMIMHTCNPRLHPPQLIFVINHAEDGALLFDPSFAPLIESILRPHCPGGEARWICLSDAENMPRMGGVPWRVSATTYFLSAASKRRVFVAAIRLNALRQRLHYLRALPEIPRVRCTRIDRSSLNALLGLPAGTDIAVAARHGSACRAHISYQWLVYSVCGPDWGCKSWFCRDSGWMPPDSITKCWKARK